MKYTKDVLDVFSATDLKHIHALLGKYRAVTVLDSTGVPWSFVLREPDGQIIIIKGHGMFRLN